jgi:hypothetical protein
MTFFLEFISPNAPNLAERNGAVDGKIIGTMEKNDEHL